MSERQGKTFRGYLEFSREKRKQQVTHVRVNNATYSTNSILPLLAFTAGLPKCDRILGEEEKGESRCQELILGKEYKKFPKIRGS